MKKFLGLGSKGFGLQRKRVRGPAISSTLPIFRVINRDKAVSSRKLAPGALDAAAPALAADSCLSSYHDVEAAFERAYAEYARTLDNLVVVSESGDILLELGLE